MISENRLVKQEYLVKITTWKIPCQCPRCGKQYLFADIEDPMDVNADATFLDALLRRGRFRKLPDTVYCEGCGDIDPSDIVCQFPVTCFAIGLHRSLLIISFAGIVGTILIVLLFHYILD